MNREDIIRMAREAGLDPDLWNYTDAFERFATLVAAAEREACAKAVLDDAWALTFQTFGQYRTALAAAIRARGKV